MAATIGSAAITFMERLLRVGSDWPSVRAASAPRQPRAIARLFRALFSIFVVPLLPVRAALTFGAALGHEVEVLVIRVQHVDAAGVGRVGVEHAAARVTVEHTDALALGGVRVLEREVVERPLAVHLLRRERD